MIAKAAQQGQEMQFDGAKVALFLGARMVVILRDNLPGRPFAGYWDLPGGGREGEESPFGCVARECHEELGLRLLPADIAWSRAFDSAAPGKGIGWFFAAHLAAEAAQEIRFGEEGQRWALMTPEAFLGHSKAIPAFQTRLRQYLREAGR
jgi:8-oxo-dGTP diphosphatase